MTTVLDRHDPRPIDPPNAPSVAVVARGTGDPGAHAAVARAVVASPLGGYLAGLRARHLGVSEGQVAAYIPELGRADPDWFGIAAISLDGTVHAVGDAERPFTIQSISKPLTYALALEDLGEERVRARIGVEPTGDAFNAIALAPQRGTPLNPMVNAGAIAAAGLIERRGGMDATERLLSWFGRFAGRPLAVDETVLESERVTGHRNRAIGHLLKASGVIDGDPMEAVDRYFTQCSLAVTAVDLARIAATLANGGVDPVTGERIASAATVRTVLSVMATCGMYDGAGEWLVSVGLPAKSGVAGGLLAVVPGRLGIGVFSPPLDAQGNSVRGTRVCRDLVRDLELHPLAGGGTAAADIRATYSLAEVGSRCRRSPAQRDILTEQGRRAVVIELHGALGFLTADTIARSLERPASDDRVELAILDLRRVERIEPAGIGLFADFVAGARSSGIEVIVAGATRHGAALDAVDVALTGRSSEIDGPLHRVDDLDTALEAAEDRLLGDAGQEPDEAVALADQQLTQGLSPNELTEMAAALERRVFRTGDRLVRTGDPSVELFLIESGRCTVLIDLPGGARRRLTTLGAGRSFGETALIGGERRGANVVAESDVSCLVLTAAAFERLAGRRPSIARTVLRNLLGSTIQTAGRLTAELAVLAG